MSLQGDVAGIGLAEVFQSLARSEKEGVLHLESGSRSVRMGVRDGQILPLAAPGESPEQWNERCVRAWLGEMPLALRERRMIPIARAARLDSIYDMLEADAVHFRFTPGAIEGSVPGSVSDGGAGIPVEYFLLEHARLSDEHAGQAGEPPARGRMPVAVTGARVRDDAKAFVAQCDGSSTLGEIADRLGWTIRQCRASAYDARAAGEIAWLKPFAILQEIEREVGANRGGRAAERLESWCAESHPGPIERMSLERFLELWRRGALSALVRATDTRAARGFLRRLERSLSGRTEALALWIELADERRADGLAALHCAALRCAADAEAELGVVELVRLAGVMRERGSLARAGTALRVAATRAPARTATQLELGSQMLGVGMIDEGATWVLAAARELLAQREFDRAVSAARIVLKHDPGNEGAGSIAAEARMQAARAERRRVHAVAALCALLVFAVGAVVRIRRSSSRDNSIEAVRALADQPREALRLLEVSLRADETEEVDALRNELVTRVAGFERAQRDAWMNRYSSTQRECESGDPLTAFHDALSMPPPPQLDGEFGAWPNPLDLLSVLGERLWRTADELDHGVDTTLEQVREEKRLLGMLDDLDAEAAEYPDAGSVKAFRAHVDQTRKAVTEHQEERALERARRSEAATLAAQDQLLATARAHAEAGDLTHALTSYDALIAQPDSEDFVKLLLPEIEQVRGHAKAIDEALALARSGDHDRARWVLSQHCPDPTEHLLPWRVSTRPSGARARFADGSQRVTPFTLQSGIGESVEFTLEYPGYETQPMHISIPANLEIALSREPEWTWAAGGRVEAAPVPVGEDHIVADRRGNLARLAPDGAERWSLSLDTLSGIARTPLFLPGRPGQLLVLSEDGDVWAVDAAKGTVESSYDMKMPPMEGPLLLRGMVVARFTDRRVAAWRDRAEPTTYETEPLYLDGNAPVSIPDSTDCALSANLCLLRRSATSDIEVVSPWTGWSVRVDSDLFHVTHTDGRTFAVRRAGQWHYVCWEEPNALVPAGRLWVSDETGLRSFRP